ncbi:hypothetical protein EMCG_08324 [[Emmonsia] crescens]|uniref:Uncharacterized protein n=1 Tax=[Emmonsia] crescens TaxID=73230 RepID=A0A0G2J4J9_9EURO|nr:hypothetical protein EMCG_08324 [Emmonsia crescens UAMH 3008]
MEPSYIKPKSNARQGISPSTPSSFSEKFEARLKELRQKQSNNTLFPVNTETSVTPAAKTTPVTGTTAAGRSSNLLVEETMSVSALEQTAKRADRPIAIQQLAARPTSKRKRPTVDPIQCTCAVSEECQRAARDGLSDCRIGPGVPIPKRKQKPTGPRPARENAP